MVEVPRQLLEAAASELRLHSRHVRIPLIEPAHDRRMSDGSCAVCTLIELLEDYAEPET